MENLTNEEINRRIHLEVMKLCVHNPSEFAVGMLMCTECNSILDDADVLDDLPDYCTSIADAWRVVEKMQGDFFVFHLSVFPEGNGRVQSAQIVKLLQPENSVDSQMNDERYGLSRNEYPRVFDKSLPKAICLAALKTVSD